MYKIHEIDVIILCGGFGTRLRTVVNDRPKPMAQIGDKTFLDILIAYVAGFGFRRFVLCTGYKQSFISDHYKNIFKELEIVISEESEPLGTAGAIKNAQKHIRNDKFLAMNGDSFCQMDLCAFLDFHESKKALTTIALIAKDDPSDYGTVQLDDNSKIVSFKEKIKEKVKVKTSDSTLNKGLINAGIYLFHRSILDKIPGSKKYSMEYDLFPSLLVGDIYGYITEGTFIDIGTPERYKEAIDLFVK